ncbi:rhodanese-related sulfurtransferase [Bisgaardia hudsonensis]|uniref:Rhodanese-related sulfurtransferase n=1 Tax=Bisgaardia hudsonensis TaxID=109472 RepID=A0A4R2N1R7_9PAST|nr:rhodanese family protein [Bisgaardia hudsonensis]QLB12928.1 hypothetical protein A6A11_04555 [Bisgaardia hudsonensis]TCP13512.1 rhodanese-related sulfurtransferase [Bisgaardia hudsonensis]
MIDLISVADVQEKLRNGAVLVDIREADEFKREHIADSLNEPMSQLQKQGISNAVKGIKELIFCCRSGARTVNNAALLKQITENMDCKIFILEKGIIGWKEAGNLTEINRSQPLELMRQVQIVAGSLVLIGVLLGWLVSPKFYLLSAFVGSGLMFAGISGFCGMAILLAKMPWNKVS